MITVREFETWMFMGKVGGRDGKLIEWRTVDGYQRIEASVAFRLRGDFVKFIILPIRTYHRKISIPCFSVSVTGSLPGVVDEKLIGSFLSRK